MSGGLDAGGLDPGCLEAWRQAGGLDLRALEAGCPAKLAGWLAGLYGIGGAWLLDRRY